MPPFRSDKIRKTLIKEIADIIQKKLNDSRIGGVVSITDLEISHDNSYAKVFYSVFAPDEQKELTIKAIEDDASKIREIVSKFDDKDIVSNIKEDKNGINIYIGSESEFDDDVSIIKTHYTLNGEEGTIALIGPKRMEYDRAITLLNYIMDNLDS